MLNAPKVTILVPVYNAGRFLKESLTSILDQSFTDFELLIIDDGSTDNSLDIIKSITDKRLRLICNEFNRGLAYTRNKGIDEAKGEYLAFLDSDDICHIHRLETQVNFLNKNLKFAGCGSHAFIINESSEITGKIITCVDADEIKVRLFFNNTFVNSSMMIRTGIAKKYRYNDFYSLAEDYDLWSRISSNYQLINLNDFLVQYRIHSNNISIGSNAKKQNLKKFEDSIFYRMRLALGFTNDSISAEIHYALYDNNFRAFTPPEYHTFLCTAQQLNKKNQLFNLDLFNTTLLNYWYNILISSNSNNVIGQFLGSPLFSIRHCTFKQLRRLFKNNLKKLFK